MQVTTHHKISFDLFLSEHTYTLIEVSYTEKFHLFNNIIFFCLSRAKHKRKYLK